MKKKPDPAHIATDQELAALEKRIAAEYKKAADELNDKINAYFESFKKRDEETKALIGTIVNGKEYTEQDYKQWRLAQIGRGKRFEALRDRVAERMTHANEVAAAYINDRTAGIYSLNRNYAAYTIEQQVGADVGFDLWDEQTVKRLIVEQPDLMPYYPPKRAVKRGIDLVWGKRQITAQVTSGILQGESINHLADRLQTNIPNMNRDSAIRTARTAVTGAQNAGRQDSYDAAVKMGIEMEKQWLATLDGRTRHDHAAADGQTVAEDKPFRVGGYELMYPGDPRGPGHEIYNCRCTVIAKVKSVDISDAKRRAKDPDTGGNVIIDNMTYEKWVESKKNNTKKLTVDESLKLNDLRQKYKTLESAMLFGEMDEVSEFSRLLEKERASSGEYDFDLLFNGQKITESEIYKWQKEPTKEVKDAISSYSRSGYVKINDHLRAGAYVPADIQKQIDDLSKYLSECKTEETLYLKRGISVGSVEKILGGVAFGSNTSNAIGQIIFDKGFVSTTPYYGGGFGGNVTAYIKAPAGTRGAYIRKYAAAENEKEFLLDKGQMFIVRNLKEITDKWGDKKYELFLEVVT